MYINRFSISFSKIEDNYTKEEVLYLNKASDAVEEMFFHLLPIKVKLGEYGFITTYPMPFKTGKNRIKEYGQMLDVFCYSVDTNPIIFKNQNNLFNYLLELMDFSITYLSNHFNADPAILLSTIKSLRINGPLIEYELKVSRTHPSKQIRVSIIRCIKLSGENIKYIILNKKKEILHESEMINNSSIYHVSYDFRKSYWENDTLVILDRFDEIKFKIEVKNYIS